MRGAMLDQFGPMRQVGSQGHHLGIRPDGAIEQAQAVELLQPERFA
jgi:hypothetical protein